MLSHSKPWITWQHHWRAESNVKHNLCLIEWQCGSPSFTPFQNCPFWEKYISNIFNHYYANLLSWIHTTNICGWIKLIHISLSNNAIRPPCDRIISKVGDVDANVLDLDVDGWCWCKYGWKYGYCGVDTYRCGWIKLMQMSLSDSAESLPCGGIIKMPTADTHGLPWTPRENCCEFAAAPMCIVVLNSVMWPTKTSQRPLTLGQAENGNR